MRKFIDLTGKKFGRWTVLSFAGREKNITFFWCECECKRQRKVSSTALIQGRSTKCKNCHFDCMTSEKGSYTHGYIRLRKNHPNSGKGNIILEHTYVMSEFLGRPLRKGENVHHKNGIRDDNRLENLELWSTNQPAGQRIADKYEWCCQFIAEYEETLKKLHG